MFLRFILDFFNFFGLLCNFGGFNSDHGSIFGIFQVAADWKPCKIAQFWAHLAPVGSQNWKVRTRAPFQSDMSNFVSVRYFPILPNRTETNRTETTETPIFGSVRSFTATKHIYTLHVHTFWSIMINYTTFYYWKAF